MSDPEPMPEPDQIIDGPRMIGPAEILGVITLMTGLLANVESRIIDRLNSNAAAAEKRWALWEARIEILERQVAEHLRIAHDEQLATEARVRPVLKASSWIWQNRGSLLILLIGIATLWTEILAPFFFPATHV
jgi:ParB-like chromosome segregation protein Spo0J